MAARSAVVIGSGAGGSLAAMEFARAGWQVVVFEKGPSHVSNLGGEGPIGTVFARSRPIPGLTPPACLAREAVPPGPAPSPTAGCRPGIDDASY